MLCIISAVCVEKSKKQISASAGRKGALSGAVVMG